MGIVDDRANALLRQANAHHKSGEVEEAARLYSEVAGDPQSLLAVATAATGLARLNAREEARAAIDRVAASPSRPALVTARLGEAAAAVGDLDLARECAGAVLEDSDVAEPAVRTAMRVLEQAGEPSAALRIAHGTGDVASVNRIGGTLRSYDPTWLPTSGYPRSLLRPWNRRVFTLLETSLPHVSSGYTYRAQTLLRAQQRAGLEPTALTRLGFPATRGVSIHSADQTSEFGPPETSWETVDGVDHHRFFLPGVRYYSSVPMPEQLSVNAKCASVVSGELQPEGIIATTPHLNGLVALALRNERRIPMIYDVRGFPEMTWAVRKGGESTEVFQLRRRAETRCMQDADLVTTLSETMRQHIISRGISPENVLLLPHAVDTDAFSPIDRDEKLAAKLGLAGRPIVGYISSLVAYEGVETLLDAIAAARRTNPDIAGLIVGSGDLQSTLEARSKRLGLDRHVLFTGRVDAEEVSSFYSLMDVFVCPRQDHEVTRYVTPLKPFEAMATGSCIVVSDLPTLRESVCDGECGALFPAGNSEALAATILSLIDFPEHSHRLRETARRHVIQNHSLKRLTSQFEHVWSELHRRAMLDDNFLRPLPELDCL